jgi:hypothetical protein
MSYLKKQILMASKHQKERVVAPIFKKYLGCHLLASDLDTDQFGTFTGEVARLKDALSTCKDKAILAAKHSNYPYAVASEGSFGPHPQMPFFAYAQEWMVFVDLDLGLCIQEEWRTQETNYQTKLIEPKTDIQEFLKQTGFPSHALCLQTANLKTVLAKGIQTEEELFHCLEQGFKQENQLLLSTDMRAMMNPTRMQVIEKLAEKLALRILSLCPACQTPGYGQQGWAGYLNCRQCDWSSNVPAFEVWACMKCNYQEQKTRQDGKVSLEPQYCQFCNP